MTTLMMKLPESASGLWSGLHRSRGRFALAIAASAAALCPSCAAPTSETEVIRARAIQMVDDDGRVRAELGIDADGSAGLFLYDSEGRTRACLVHDPSQSALYLFDDQNVIRVGAAQFAHGGGGLAIHGERSRGSTVLYQKNGVGSLTLRDADGNLIGRVPAATGEAGSQP